jgi:hypothetical protein
MNDIYKAPESRLNDPADNTSGMGAEAIIPYGVKGWSWGAFMFNWIWAIGNRTWIGLLAIVPYVGFVMAIVLGFKGREWAWRNKKWQSIEHFQKVQRRWSLWSLLIVGIAILGIVAAIVLPAYNNYIVSAGT